MTDDTLPPRDVAAAFDAMAPDTRAVLLRVRALVVDLARHTPETGGLVETLKWGQPAYLPRRARVGTTLRLGQTADQAPALFVHCQTRLISDYRSLFPDRFTYDGTRAVRLPAAWDATLGATLAPLIHAALRYHLDRRAVLSAN